MTNLDLIREQFKRDSFANKFRIVLDDVTETTVKAHMVLDLSSLNLFGRRRLAKQAARADVDAKRLGLFGGSQAGWIILRAAALSTLVRFAVITSMSVGEQDAYAGLSPRPPTR